jgi:hypothetical protein
MWSAHAQPAVLVASPGTTRREVLAVMTDEQCSSD